MPDIDVPITAPKELITNKTTVTAVSGDFVLISDTSDSGNLKKVNASDFLGGGGGTNTIAVEYSNTINSALTDTTTFFLGQMGALVTNVLSFAHVPLPPGTLREIRYNSWTTNTLGAEEATLSLVHAGGTIEIGTDFLMNARNINRNFTGLDEAIAEGNSYFTFLTPAYANNPGNAQLRITLIMEV